VTAKPIPMRHCFFCGEELGRYLDYDPLDNCGRIEGRREAQRAAEIERDEAHRKLDRDMGWDR